MDTKKEEPFYNEEHFVEDHEKFQVLFEDQQLCDITLISADDNFKIKAHKMVLTSVSKYFLAMFGGSMRESEAEAVKLNQIDGPSLKLILDFIYQGLIELTPDTVEGVFVAADIVELPALSKICIDYMERNVTSSNCLSISRIARLHNNEELYNAAMIYFCEHFVELKNEQSFLLQTDEELCHLISRNDLRTSSEGDVLLNVMAWVDYEKHDRKQFLGKLLTNIRYPLVTPGYIIGIVEKLSFSIRTIRFLCKLFIWHVFPSLRSTFFPEERCRIRNLKDAIVGITGFKNTDKDLDVALYYPPMKEWIYTKGPAVPYARECLRYIVLNRKLFVTDGPSGVSFSNRVDCLNLETLEWEDATYLRSSPTFLMTIWNNAVCAINDKCFSKLRNPFNKWISSALSSQMILKHVQPHTTYGDNLYIFNNDSYWIYNFAEDIFKQHTLKRKTSGSILGVHIIRHLDFEYLVEITSNFVYLYDLQTTDCVSKTKISFNYACNKTALHGKNIIIYGGKMFYVYNVFKNKMYNLPKLNSDQDVEVLLTNTNN